MCGCLSRIEYIVNAQPKECLNRAISDLLSRGYSIDNRAGESVTLSRSPEIQLTGFNGCILLVGSLFSMGIFLAVMLLIVALGIWKWRATLVTLPTQDGRTRLTAGGSNPKVNETLEAMVQEVFGDQAVPAHGT